MESKTFDQRVAEQMKEVVALLEDQDLLLAEKSMRLLAQEVRIVSDEPIRERKLANLRLRLQSGIRHIQRVAPLTALIRFRQALTSWLAA